MSDQNLHLDAVASFYDAFKRLDAEAMVLHYSDKIIFDDPAFGALHGERAKNMWRMLCDAQRGKQMTIKASNIVQDASEPSIVTANWEAQYTFGKGNRPVHNRIQARFEFENGKIIRHSDTFDLYRWTRQALGISGRLLGWTSFFQNKLRTQVNERLTRYEQRKKAK